MAWYYDLFDSTFPRAYLAKHLYQKVYTFADYKHHLSADLFSYSDALYRIYCIRFADNWFNDSWNRRHDAQLEICALSHASFRRTDSRQKSDRAIAIAAIAVQAHRLCRCAFCSSGYRLRRYAACGRPIPCGNTAGLCVFAGGKKHRPKRRMAKP